MANIKSQKKRIRQNARRQRRNQAVRSELKTRIRTAWRAAEEGQEDAAGQFRAAQRRLDEAAAKGVIHKNQAARRKARLARRLARLTSPKT